MNARLGYGDAGGWSFVRRVRRAPDGASLPICHISLRIITYHDATIMALIDNASPGLASTRAFYAPRNYFVRAN